MIPQLFPAVRAVDKIAENAFRSVFLFGRAALGLADQLLHLFKGGAVDDRLMHVLEYHLLFFRRFKTFLVFEGLGIGLEIDNVAAVFLPREDAGNGGTLPLAGVGLGFLTASAHAFFVPVGGAVEVPLVLHDAGDGVDAVAFEIELEDLPHHRRRLRVDDPAFLILRIFHIPIGRLSERNARLAARFVRRTAFAADIFGVKLVEDVANRHEIVVFIDTVHIVVDGDKSHIVLGEELLCVVANLQIFTPESGHILDDQRRNETVFNILHQPLNVGTVKVGAGVAVVNIDADVLKAVVFGVSGEKLFLIFDGVALLIRPIVPGQSAIESSDADRVVFGLH